MVNSAARRDGEIFPPAGEENTSVPLDGADEPSVEVVQISPPGEVTERHDGEIRKRSYLKAVFESHPLVEVPCEEQLLLQRGAKRGDPGELKG